MTRRLLPPPEPPPRRAAAPARHHSPGAASLRASELRPLLDTVATRRRLRYKSNAIVFRQGDPTDAVYFIESGRIKLSRVGANGREVILAVLMNDDFLGENCLIDQPAHPGTAVALTDSQLLRIEKSALLALLRTNQAFAEHFISYLVSRNARFEDELQSQLSNSAERRLARCLLLLAYVDTTRAPMALVPYISHETLAQIIGTTRARISRFMNTFRERGWIEYSRREIVVHPTLLALLLQDDPTQLEAPR